MAVQQRKIKKPLKYQPPKSAHSSLPSSVRTIKAPSRKTDHNSEKPSTTTAVPAITVGTLRFNKALKTQCMGNVNATPIIDCNKVCITCEGSAEPYQRVKLKNDTTVRMTQKSICINHMRNTIGLTRSWLTVILLGIVFIAANSISSLTELRAL